MNRTQLSITHHHQITFVHHFFFYFLDSVHIIQRLTLDINLSCQVQQFDLFNLQILGYLLTGVTNNEAKASSSARFPASVGR